VTTTIAGIVVVMSNTVTECFTSGIRIVLHNDAFLSTVGASFLEVGEIAGKTGGTPGGISVNEVHHFIGVRKAGWVWFVIIGGVFILLFKLV
jgi:hypothetical protein